MGTEIEMETDIVRFGIITIGHCIVIIIGVLLWSWIWLKRVGIEIPIDTTIPALAKSHLGEFHITHSLRMFRDLMWP